ncbi:MAG: hypothetical protein SWK90_14040 [Chloroflexota bacterium]|nr:hypothetical protein [Chloroflexota bacterium]
MTEKARDRWVYLLVLVIYTLLALAYAWPLITRFGDRLAGDGFDMYVFQWGNWWTPRALGQGHSPYHTRMLFYPQGVSLYFLSFSWLNTFVWWLLRGLVGNVAAYNFTVWWSWPLAGFGAYLLAREVADDRRAAFVAGLVYAFYPYHFAQRNHINLLSVQWIPFALLFLIRAVRRGRVLDGFLTGIFFACAGLSGWHLLTLSGMLGGLWFLYAWLTERHEWTGTSWWALLVTLITVGLLAGPFIAPLAWEQFVNPAGQDPYLGKEGETQTDLVAYFLPNLYHPLWGRLAAPVHQRFLRSKDHAVSLGYLPLALVGYGLLQRRASARRGRFWLWGLLVFWLLSLGPFLRANGVPYPQMPLPYRLVGWSLPVRSLRNPERFNIIVGLCLAMVVGLAVRDLLRRRPARQAGLVVVVLSVLVLLEYWAWPFPTTRPGVPDFYRQLAVEPGDFAIVDLPITNDLSKLYMYYQTVHGRPTITGHVSRSPEGAYDFIAAHGLLRAMWHDRRPDPTGDPAAELAALADIGVRYVVVHPAHLNEKQLEEVLTYLDRATAGVRYHTDERLIVYRTAWP